jgi:hypothetical protein
MVALAILQNLWARDPERVRKVLANRSGANRRRVIRTVLFGGCLTGRRLTAAFGEELRDQMLWEEASTEVAGDARIIIRPDPDHIRRVLWSIEPDLVIGFGRLACDAVEPLCSGTEFLRAPHPAARRSDTMARLRAIASNVRRRLESCS